MKRTTYILLSLLLAWTSVTPLQANDYLEQQNHNVAFSSNTDQAMCDAIRSALDAVLGTPQGLEDVRTENLEVRTEKVIRDGKLYILRAGKTYDALGREVK